jgi:hypothetical protein
MRTRSRVSATTSSASIAARIFSRAFMNRL